MSPVDFDDDVRTALIIEQARKLIDSAKGEQKNG